MLIHIIRLLQMVLLVATSYILDKCDPQKAENCTAAEIEHDDDERQRQEHTIFECVDMMRRIAQQNIIHKQHITQKKESLMAMSSSFIDANSFGPVR